MLTTCFPFFQVFIPRHSCDAIQSKWSAMKKSKVAEAAAKEAAKRVREAEEEALRTAQEAQRAASEATGDDQDPSEASDEDLAWQVVWARDQNV